MTEALRSTGLKSTSRTGVAGLSRRGPAGNSVTATSSAPRAPPAPTMNAACQPKCDVTAPAMTKENELLIPVLAP